MFEWPVQRSQIAGVTAVSLGAFTAANAMLSRRGSVLSLFDSAGVSASAASAAVGTVLAMLIATVVRHQIPVIAAAAVGVAVIGVVAARGGVGDVELYAAAVGAGLLFGAMAALAGGRTTLQAGLVTGAVAGLLLAERIASYQRSGSVFEQYGEYSPASAVPVDWFALALCLGTLGAIVVAMRYHGFASFEAQPGTVRVVVIGVVLPAACLGLSWLFNRTVAHIATTGLQHWLIGLIIVPVVVVCALVLPGRQGWILASAPAITAASSSAGSVWSDTAWPVLAISAALVVAGAIAGRLRPHPVVGATALVVVVVSKLLDHTPLDSLYFAAVLFVLPFAAAYAFVSCLPSTPSMLAIAALLPITLTVPLFTEFGWTAYTPLTSVPDSGWASYSVTSWQYVSAGAGSAVVLIAAAAILWSRRRSVRT